MKFSKEQLVILWCSLLGGFLVSWLLVGKMSIRSLYCLLIAGGIMYGVWQAVVWGLVRIGHRSNGGITDFMVEIYKLPPESAKATAEDLLRDESRFICIRAEEDLPDNIAALGGCVADLFARYQGIKRVGGDAILGWDQVGESEYLKGFVRIGIDTDFVEYAARPNIHGVYELDGSDQSIQDVGPPAYPSVYHLILMIDRSYSGK